MGPNLYQTLGVAPDSGALEIKKAFRSLALRSHPDHNPDDAQAEARFKRVAAAYEVLGDVQKRARYDLLNGFRRSDASVQDAFATLASLGELLTRMRAAEAASDRNTRGAPRQRDSTPRPPSRHDDYLDNRCRVLLGIGMGSLQGIVRQAVNRARATQKPVTEKLARGLGVTVVIRNGAPALSLSRYRAEPSELEAKLVAEAAFGAGNYLINRVDDVDSPDYPVRFRIFPETVG